MKNYAKFKFRDPFYSAIAASNIQMCILKNFLTDDINYDGRFFKEWAVANKVGDKKSGYTDYCGGNITYLEAENGYASLSCLLNYRSDGPEVIPLFTITLDQLIEVIDTWLKLVKTIKPQEIVIYHENNQFTFEWQ